MLCLIEGIPEFSDLKSEISNLKLEAEGISRQLRAWADKLQNTGIKGQQCLDDKLRQREAAARDRADFLNQLQTIRAQASRAKPLPST